MPNTYPNLFVPQIEDQSVQLSSILDTLPSIVFYVDNEYHIKYLNTSFEIWSGFTKEQARGKQLKEILDYKTFVRIKDFIDKALAGVVIDFETELLFKNGTKHLMEGSFKPDLGDAGQVKGIVAFLKERLQKIANNLEFDQNQIATKKSADEKLLYALRSNEERYFQLVNGLPAALYTCDAEGRILMYNEAAAALWGRRPEIGKDLWCGSWKIFDLQGNPVPLDKCPMAFALKEGKPINLAEIIVERPDGVKLNVLANPKPILDSSGKVVEAVNMLVDVTSLKWAEQALRESEERFNKIADSAPVMIWMSGTDMGYNFFNKGWLDFTGRTLAQEKGFNWVKNVHPDDFDLCIDTYTEAFENKGEFKMEYRLKRHDGVYRWVIDSGRPRFSPDGTFIGFIGSCIDVSDNKMMAEALEKEVELRTLELKQVNQQLLRYNEELEQFAYAASHDLQEPLRKIQTFAGMLVERNFDELNEAGKNYLSKILKSTERMSGIINDLLSYSRQSRLDEMFEEIDLNLIIENVLSDLELMIQQKGAQVICDVLPNIKAIPSQMSRLFYNLINNSLKFSNPNVPPKITISAKQFVPDENGRLPSTIEFLVRDNGIGFEQKYADRVFQLFQRLNDKHSYDGNGIGLALCKKIIQNHFGEIYAEAQPNVGAIFHLKFPSNILVEAKTLAV
ncbi:PAS domain S-box protein [Chitinophagaceae bacterium LB-8]|uniref:histidine kinase n=1 Tax=Paraflavisolibacter caeni TaxID=2982496 RepID=A0A9X2XW00_9BACT|nr:PAS domain S-box protein [Paraflavisolibacter caeni]MCU7550241.1 PAS domain S-box protein [Paraflavisolibacter caeni]